MTLAYPILEFDPDPTAVVPPDYHGKTTSLQKCVLCFFYETLHDLVKRGKLVQIDELQSEIGPNPIYALEHGGEKIAVLQPGVGAPLSAAFLDELIAMGFREFIACGGCGVLDQNLAMGHLIVPTAAIRDEGTSYHYLPPGREVSASPQAVAAIEKTLKAHGVEYLLSKAWTTDAPYRETRAKIQRRREEGCLVVEMEAAAFFAVAQFRGVTFGQILYGGDDVSGSEWDSRGWDSHTTLRERVFWLAVDSILAIESQAK